LIAIIISSYGAFQSIYYGRNKTALLLLWTFYGIILLISLQIETSYDTVQALRYILLFRFFSVLLLGDVLLTFIINRNYRYLSVAIMIGAVLLLSFQYHYITLYVCLFSVLPLRFATQPEKSDVLVKRESAVLLENLHEPLAVLSLSGEPFLVNREMRKLIKKEDSPKLDLNRILLSIGEGGKDDSLLFIGYKAYQIHHVLVEKKGHIVTLCDVSGEVELQKKIRMDISELEVLSEQLREYSLETESILISREREKLLNYISNLIGSGMKGLDEVFENHKREEKLPYSSLLVLCRGLLNEIRSVVSNWRSIAGDHE